jgi:hypothetical protein
MKSKAKLTPFAAFAAILPLILGVGGTGFSATLFKNSQTGAYSFAIRGTEPGYADLLGADFGDIVMDGIAMDQVVDMYNYWQSLNHVGSLALQALIYRMNSDWALENIAGLFNPDYPLGGASRLRERWRPVCGHFCRLFVVHGITMNSSQATKLSRNPPRHHLAS